MRQQLIIGLTMRKVVVNMVSGCTYHRRILQILKRTEFNFDMWSTGGRDVHRMPSSSDDFTLANITSDANGLNTTILNTTTSRKLVICQLVLFIMLRTFIP